MSPCLLVVVEWWNGFPRVSGDEPVTQAVARDVLGFSPRERG